MDEKWGGVMMDTIVFKQIEFVRSVTVRAVEELSEQR